MGSDSDSEHYFGLSWEIGVIVVIVLVVLGVVATCIWSKRRSKRLSREQQNDNASHRDVESGARSEHEAEAEVREVSKSASASITPPSIAAKRDSCSSSPKPARYYWEGR
ncbi:hypothetical protein DL96DRAFT_1561487 [Flagelloscypha sp. PMI_526]|nr:hypothetical protein DL96DRAFT_1561487 [Flagelloscypha sp. PMI_526]